MSPIDNGLKRRDFFAAIAGATGGYLLSRLPFRRLAGLDDVDAHVSAPEVERWVRSSCLLCSSACGIEVRLLDGLPVGLRGNPLHPVNRGGLCAVGQEGLHVLHHPDRIRGPLKRAGERGAGSWVEITWEQAIAEVAERLGGIVSAGSPEEIVFLDGCERGLMPRLIERFMTALGSSNHVADTPPSGLSAMMQLAQGVDRAPAYDLEQAEYVLSFGAPLLEGWRSPLQGQRAYGALRDAGDGRRKRLVQVDVRQSPTASHADRFVPVTPGSYGALALSIAYVIIREGLYDEEFVQRHTFGFDSWRDESGTMHRGFRERVLDLYRPDRMAEVTGVPPDTVVTIAKEFAAARPAVAVVDHAATLHSNGVNSALAVQALNALIGSIDRRGGALVGEDVPFADWPALGGEQPRARPGTRRIDGRGDTFPFGSGSVTSVSHAILNQGQDVQALLLYYSNPCFSAPNPERFARALARVPFVVSFTPMPDESSHFADLILPDHTYLERWQDAVGPSSFAFSTLGITRPVVAPLYDTRHTGDVLLEVAGQLGGELAEALPWRSFEELLKQSVEGVFEAGRGTILTDEQTSSEVRELEMRGWWIPRHRSYGEFWKDLLDQGGWWDPAYVYGLWARVFATPSRRYEFRSQLLEQTILERAARGDADLAEPERVLRALDELGLQGDLDEAVLPHHAPAVFDGFRSPRDLHLHLNLFRPLVPNSGVMADLPWVRDILHPHTGWELWVELHPADAEELGIGGGEWVWIISPVGRVRALTALDGRAQRGVLNVPLGLGREVAGRWGRLRGANPQRLLAGGVEPLASIPASLSTMVRVEKASPEGSEHG